MRPISRRQFLQSTLFLPTLPLLRFQPPPAIQSTPVRFAVIGDYGWAGEGTRQVADMVRSWSPDFIITTGDNNYPAGEAATIDANIGQYYADFIGNYRGAYGTGSPANRFFPALGNHDWMQVGAQPYLDYFTLPNNGRYYDFQWGDVHLFSVDSMPDEPDGAYLGQPQSEWLRTALAASTARWKLVYFHHSPYTSGEHGNYTPMQWPFAAWGASAVFSGHDHHYERLNVDGIPYFVNGVGGASLYATYAMIPASQVAYSRSFGAMLVTADSAQLTFEYYSVLDPVPRDIWTLR